MSAERAHILCVDDEPKILEALVRNLRQHFKVTTAVGGEAGVEALKRQGPFEVVVSDMRMPGMDGVAFLGFARKTAPDAVRILLTGQADMKDAIGAINEGAIFRYITKPCALPSLIAALEAAVEQNRLITAERVLLRETLQGSLKALLDVLSLANPAAFGRALRAKQYVAKFLPHLDIPDPWQVEVAAMFSQLGCVTLPLPLVEKLYHGIKLAPKEQALVDRLPQLAAELIAHIPRLEGVKDILLNLDKRFDGSGSPESGVQGKDIPIGSRILKLVLDFDILLSQNCRPETAVDDLRSRRGWYDPALLEILASFQTKIITTAVEKRLFLKEIREGMQLVEDVRTKSGMLLIARGQEVTKSILEKLHNLAPGIGVAEPILVVDAKGEALGSPAEVEGVPLSVETSAPQA